MIFSALNRRHSHKINRREKYDDVPSGVFPDRAIRYCNEDFSSGSKQGMILQSSKDVSCFLIGKFYYYLGI